MPRGVPNDPTAPRKPRVANPRSVLVVDRSGSIDANALKAVEVLYVGTDGNTVVKNYMDNPTAVLLQYTPPAGTPSDSDD